MSTLRDLGEFEVIRRLLAARPAPPSPAAIRPGHDSAADAVVVGAGDDAAILRPRAGFELVATTDTFLEGAHFRRDWIGAEALGARLAEANLSDLAAMAAEPRWALVSFGVKPEHAVDDLAGIQRGIAAALARHGAVVAGGNLTAVAGEEWMTLAMLGEVRAAAAWTRAGARPGDLVAVTGHPGRAGAASAVARSLGEAAHEPRWAALLDAWTAPRARVGLARALAATQAVTAAVDISDGLASDLGHLCEASGLGATLDAGAWPHDAVLADAARALGRPLTSLRLGASDDYELLVAVDPAGRGACERIAAELGVPLAFIGTCHEGPGVLRWREGGAERPLAAQGYDHFAT